VYIHFNNKKIGCENPYEAKGRPLLPVICAGAVALAGGALSNASAAENEIATTIAPLGGFEPPKGWMPPPLDPTGVQLQTIDLGHGV